MAMVGRFPDYRKLSHRGTPESQRGAGRRKLSPPVCPFISNIAAPKKDAERAALANLQLNPVPASNAWIAIEDEFRNAELSEIPRSTTREVERDLVGNAMEGMTEERKAKVRRRAAWLADRFIRSRSKAATLICDDCGFDPMIIFPTGKVKSRSLLDVHHKHPLEENVRYTTIDDFSLLCPTCHRVEHVRMRLEARSAPDAG